MKAGDLLLSLRCAVHRLEETVLLLLMGSMIVLACSQIVLRNLFAITLLWAEPMIRHLVLWSGFIGALIATRADKHIKIDAAMRLFSPRQRDLLQGFTSLFSAVICLLLTWVSIRFFLDERAFGGSAFLAIPTWQLQLIFPLTFGAMSLRFLSRFGRNLSSFSRGRPA